MTTAFDGNADAGMDATDGAGPTVAAATAERGDDGGDPEVRRSKAPRALLQILTTTSPRPRALGGSPRPFCSCTPLARGGSAASAPRSSLSFFDRFPIVGR